jgi:hypothetical protein|tara:strand:+ start:100 stop:279 length:180 start_codon:yes stop_codon:yes gene_type:complete
MSRLVRKIHLWRIGYFKDEMWLSTVINTGFIYDIHLVEQYFRVDEPEAKHINIHLIIEE